MFHWFELLTAELRRSWIQFIRYPIEALISVAIITIVFYGLFLGARYMAGPGMDFGDRLDTIVIGYVLWSLVIYVVNDIALGLQQEAQTGTLEQVFLSPFGAPQVFMARAIASLTLRMVIVLLTLLIIMGLTGSQIQFPPSLFLPLFTLLGAAYGLSFLMGAFALLVKQVQQLLGLAQFFLLFVIATPTQNWTGTMALFSHLLPMVPSAKLLRDVMARGQGLSEPELAIAFTNGLIYLLLGLFAFHWAEQQAKQRDLLSGY
ncbi:MAG: ABC transporter permease [Symploca sp. SIO2B6]|nr:ABC transporter permease [Symploca sp. SIO2B6]